MANMTKNASGNWVYNSSDSSSHTLSTKNLYLDGNIVVNGAGTPTRSGNTVSWGTGWITSGSSTGSTTSLTAGSGSASLSGSKVTLVASGSKINDISVTATGSGTVSAGTGWITSGSKSSNSATSTQYLSGVILSTPSSGTNKFNITVPNGSGTITF